MEAGYIMLAVPSLQVVPTAVLRSGHQYVASRIMSAICDCNHLGNDLGSYSGPPHRSLGKGGVGFTTRPMKDD